MVKLQFIGERTRGIPDDVHVVDILEYGKIYNGVEFLNNKIFKKHAYMGSITTWKDRNTADKKFRCVHLGDFKMVWVDERGEWVGFRHGPLPSEYETYWSEHPIQVDGPYALDERCAKAIQGAYFRPDIDLKKILRTSHSELNQIAYLREIGVVHIYSDVNEETTCRINLYFNNKWEIEKSWETVMGHDVEPMPSSCHHNVEEILNNDEGYIDRIREELAPFANRLGLDLELYAAYLATIGDKPGCLEEYLGLEPIQNLSVRKMIKRISVQDPISQKDGSSLYIGKNNLKIFLRN